MNRDPVELNLDFAHCYKCYRQPIGPNSSFIVLTCRHIYCDTCQNHCAGKQAPHLMFCFICRKPAKFEPITQKINVVAPFEGKLSNVADEQKPIAKRCDIKSDWKYKIEVGASKMEEQSSVCMSRKRYTELIGMVNGKLYQISCNKIADQAAQPKLSTSSFQSASQLYRQV